MSQSSPGFGRNSTTLQRASWLLAALVLLAVVVARADRWTRGPAEAYLWLGDQFRHGRVGPDVYDDERVTMEIQRLTDGRVRDIVSPSPPTLALFVAPFGYFGSVFAQRVWIGLNILAALTGLMLVFRAVGWPKPAAPLALVMTAGLLFSAPLDENVSRGQLYLLLLFCFAVATYAYETGRDWLVGLALAMALMVKVTGLPLLLMLGIARRWKVLAWAAATTAGVVLASIVRVSIDTYVRWITDVVPAWLATPKMMVPAYQTATGFVQHLLRADPQWNTVPVADAPVTARILAVLITIGLLAVTVRRMNRRVQPPTLPFFAAGVVLSVILQPTAEQYAYLSAFVPLVVAVRGCLKNPTTRFGAWLVAASVLMLAPLPYKNPRLWSGLTALFAYPRLYGGG